MSNTKTKRTWHWQWPSPDPDELAREAASRRQYGRVIQGMLTSDPEESAPPRDRSKD
jgi:hypothetical protein